MYIVAIGWAYVILMMAITSGSFMKGLMVAIFLGALPLWLLVYVAGSSRRRSMADPPPDAPDGKNSETDQQ